MGNYETVFTNKWVNNEINLLIEKGETISDNKKISWKTNMFFEDALNLNITQFHDSSVNANLIEDQA